MERIYLDSSVYVKLFKKEDGSETVKQIVSSVKGNRRLKIYLSYWVINESVAAIDQAYNKRQEITKEQRDITIATIFNKLIEYSNLNIFVVPINHKLVRESVNYIHTYNLSADDALHIHIANELKCGYFVTDDGHIKLHINSNLGGLRIVRVTNKNEMSDLLDKIL